MGKKVLIMPSPPNSGSLGSTLKFIGLAQNLVEDGWETAFVLGGHVAQLVEAASYRLYYSEPPEYHTKLQNINNYIEFVEWTGMAEEGYLSYALKRGLEIAGEFRPDVIFSQSNPAATILANTLRIPLVLFASTPSTPEFPATEAAGEYLTDHFNPILKRYRQPPIKNVCELVFDRADCVINPSIPELEPGLDRYRQVQFAGSVLNRQSGGDSTALLDRLDGRPLIFIYTSVGAIPPKLYSEIIARAFGDGEFNVLCSLGFHYEREDIITDLPENIRFVQYINIEDVMPHCAVVVFHGGQDMMLTSLIHEKPSICIPGKHFERSFNAQQMQRNQLAYWMSIYELRPRKLKRLVQMAMDEIDRERLHLFSKKITEYHGNQRCVAILDGLL